MILIGRERLRVAEPERIRRARAISWIQVWIVCQKRGREPVDRGCPRQRCEPGLAGRIQWVRIRPEIMVKGNVLSENYYHVLNCSGRSSLRPGRSRHSASYQDCTKQKRQSSSH